MGNIWGQGSLYGDRSPIMEPLPARVDLRVSACSPYMIVEDQGTTVSCVAHAFAQALYCAVHRSEPYSDMPYPQVLRIFEGAIKRSSDEAKGASFLSVAEILETEHSDVFSQFGLLTVELRNDLRLIKSVLHFGFPVVFGYQVNEEADRFHKSNESCAAHGYILPRFVTDPRAISGHTVIAVGYDDAVDSFVCRNSWGSDWGYNGHFLVRYRDVADADFFTDIMAIVDARTADGLQRRHPPGGGGVGGGWGRFVGDDDPDDILSYMDPVGSPRRRPLE